MTARIQAINTVKAVCQKANEAFGVDLTGITITIRNCGKAAGKASCRMMMGKASHLTIVLNAQLVNDENVYKLIEEVIPHEIGHLVCYLRPDLGKNHDRGWQRVCRMLGGSGERCHKYDLQKARRTRKAIYNIAGVTTDIGITVHRKIQQGAVYMMQCHHSGQKNRIRREDFTGRVVMK